MLLDPKGPNIYWLCIQMCILCLKKMDCKHFFHRCEFSFLTFLTPMFVIYKV